MKTRASLKKSCPDCFFVKRKGTLYIRCTTSAKHKQRQGLMTGSNGPEAHVCAPASHNVAATAGFQAMNSNFFAPAPVTKPQLFFGMMTGFRNMGNGPKGF